MKNANRNMILAAAAALTLAVAPSAPADVRIHLNLPIPPPPHKVLRHLPVPPLPVVVDVRHDDRYGRWNYENRHRDDRYGHNAYRYDSRYRDAARWAWVEGRWIVRPYRGAVWVTGYYDRWGRWIPGYWARARYR